MKFKFELFMTTKCQSMPLKHQVEVIKCDTDRLRWFRIVLIIVWSAHRLTTLRHVTTMTTLNKVYPWVYTSALFRLVSTIQMLWFLLSSIVHHCFDCWCMVLNYFLLKKPGKMNSPIKDEVNGWYGSIESTFVYAHTSSTLSRSHHKTSKWIWQNQSNFQIFNISRVRTIFLRNFSEWMNECGNHKIKEYYIWLLWAIWKYAKC